MLLDQRVRRVEIFTVDFSRVSASGASPQTKLYSKSYRRLRRVGWVAAGRSSSSSRLQEKRPSAALRVISARRASAGSSQILQATTASRLQAALAGLFLTHDG